MLSSISLDLHSDTSVSEELNPSGSRPVLNLVDYANRSQTLIQAVFCTAFHTKVSKSLIIKKCFFFVLFFVSFCCFIGCFCCFFVLILLLLLLFILFLFFLFVCFFVSFVLYWVFLFVFFFFVVVVYFVLFIFVLVFCFCFFLFFFCFVLFCFLFFGGQFLIHKVCSVKHRKFSYPYYVVQAYNIKSFTGGMHNELKDQLHTDFSRCTTFLKRTGINT